MIARSDVVVVGAGLVGSVLTSALLRLGYSVAWVEAQPEHQETSSDRFLVLTEPSVRWLKSQSLWSNVEVSEIRSLEISQQGSWGSCHLAPEETLGSVVSHGALQANIGACVKQQPRLTVYRPARVVSVTQDDRAVTVRVEGSSEAVLQASVLLCAEGSEGGLKHVLSLSSVTQDYHQSALVTAVKAPQGHAQRHTAYERFLKTSSQQPGGVLAVLPWKDDLRGVIWIGEPGPMQYLCDLSSEALQKQLQTAFGFRLGRLECSSEPRWMFPLKSQHLKESVNHRVVFLGNAAHQLHPMAAQGFNLSLRDVKLLEEIIQERGSLEPEVWKYYGQARKRDQDQTHWMTDQWARSLHHTSPCMALGRSMALSALNYSPWAQKKLIQWGMGQWRP